MDLILADVIGYKRLSRRQMVAGRSARGGCQLLSNTAHSAAAPGLSARREISDSYWTYNGDDHGNCSTTGSPRFGALASVQEKIGGRSGEEGLPWFGAQRASSSVVTIALRWRRSDGSSVARRRQPQRCNSASFIGACAN